MGLFGVGATRSVPFASGCLNARKACSCFLGSARSVLSSATMCLSLLRNSWSASSAVATLLAIAFANGVLISYAAAMSSKGSLRCPEQYAIAAASAKVIFSEERILLRLGGRVLSISQSRNAHSAQSWASAISSDVVVGFGTAAAPCIVARGARSLRGDKKKSIHPRSPNPEVATAAFRMSRCPSFQRLAVRESLVGSAMTPEGTCLGLARQIVPSKRNGNKETWGLEASGLATEGVVPYLATLAICLGIWYLRLVCREGQ